MRLTKDVVIALDLMEKLKGKTYPARVIELAPQLNTTQPFLKQIVHRLKKAGIVAIRRGPGGGVLRASQDPVAVVEIFKALGRPLSIQENTKEAKILAKVAEVLKSETC